MKMKLIFTVGPRSINEVIAEHKLAKAEAATRKAKKATEPEAETKMIESRRRTRLDPCEEIY